MSRSRLSRPCVDVSLSYFPLTVWDGRGGRDGPLERRHSTEATTFLVSTEGPLAPPLSSLYVCRLVLVSMSLCLTHSHTPSLPPSHHRWSSGQPSRDATLLVSIEGRHPLCPETLSVAMTSVEDDVTLAMDTCRRLVAVTHLLHAAVKERSVAIAELRKALSKPPQTSTTGCRAADTDSDSDDGTSGAQVDGGSVKARLGDAQAARDAVQACFSRAMQLLKASRLVAYTALAASYYLRTGHVVGPLEASHRSMHAIPDLSHVHEDVVTAAECVCKLDAMVDQLALDNLVTRSAMNPGGNSSELDEDAVINLLPDAHRQRTLKKVISYLRDLESSVAFQTTLYAAQLRFADHSNYSRDNFAYGSTQYVVVV